MANKQSDRRTPATTQLSGTSFWEWIVAAVGALLLVTAIGYLVWYGVARPQGPPELVIHPLSEVRQEAGSYLLQVVVKNKGYSTAASVEIAGELMDRISALRKAVPRSTTCRSNRRGRRTSSLPKIRPPTALS